MLKTGFGVQAKGALQRRMKEEGDKYREWREKHHREVAPTLLVLKRSIPCSSRV